MRGACGKLGGSEKCIQNFGRHTPGEETTWKNNHIVGKLVTKCIREIRYEDVDRLKLTVFAGSFLLA
jgi:hypothetical protein